VWVCVCGMCVCGVCVCGVCVWGVCVCVCEECGVCGVWCVCVCGVWPHGHTAQAGDNLIVDVNK